MKKLMCAQEAAQLIPDQSCVWLCAGGGGINEPSLLLKAIEQRFLDTGRPSGLTLCHSAGIGDKQGGGVDRFAHPGMVSCVIGSHWTWGVKMQQLAMDEQIEAYVLPQGTMIQLPREIAGGRPGVITKVGLGTFVDPRVEGGAMNRRSHAHLSEPITIRGQEYLLYHSFPIDVTLIRATTADEDGNLTFEHEGIIPECLAAAQAAKNSGGIVLAQVKRVVKRGTLRPLDIRVPGVLVTAVVEDREQRQSMKTAYDPALSGECHMVLENHQAALPLDARKVIARRAALEVTEGAIVNLGFGIPACVASVVQEAGAQDKIKLSVEQGITGGVPAGGSDFGLVYNPEVILEAPAQFDWYDGGGLDLAILSFAEFDQQGNVNVSRFGDRLNGVGGFINISQSARRVIFVGTLTTKGLQVHPAEGRLHIEEEGEIKKAVKQVAQISFSGQYALQRGQEVLYVTERAVFALTPNGMMLKEIAPGVDLEQDILAQMEFRPLISDHLAVMQDAIFRAEMMTL